MKNHGGGEYSYSPSPYFFVTFPLLQVGKLPYQRVTQRRFFSSCEVLLAPTRTEVTPF